MVKVTKLYTEPWPVALLVGASSQYTKVAGSILSQGRT